MFIAKANAKDDLGPGGRREFDAFAFPLRKRTREENPQICICSHFCADGTSSTAMSLDPGKAKKLAPLECDSGV